MAGIILTMEMFKKQKSVSADPSFDAGDEPSDPIVPIDELGNPLGYSSKIYGGGFNRIRVNSNQFFF